MAMSDYCSITIVVPQESILRAYHGTPTLTTLSKKASAGLGTIKRIRNLVPLETLILII